MSDLFGARPVLSLNAWLRWDIIGRMVAELQPTSILEVGCGQGAAGARLARLYDYTGYEPDPVSFAAAAERVDGHGRVVNAFLPERPEEEFDVVCAFEVLEHIEDDEAALAAWTRWIRGGGSMLPAPPPIPAGSAPRTMPWDTTVGTPRKASRNDCMGRGWRASRSFATASRSATCWSGRATSTLGWRRLRGGGRSGPPPPAAGASPRPRRR